MLNILRQLFTPAPIPQLDKLAEGLCAIPAPPQAVKVVKAPKIEQHDAYLVDEKLRRWQFRNDSSRAHLANSEREGSVPELTNFDITLLEEQGFWGKSKKVQVNNQACKRNWHKGDSAHEAAMSLGLSESWVDKRFWIFGAALSAEKAVK